MQMHIFRNWYTVTDYSALMRFHKDQTQYITKSLRRLVLSYGPSPLIPLPLLPASRGEQGSEGVGGGGFAVRHQPSFASPLRWGKKSFAPTGWGCFAIDDTVEQLPFSIFRAHVV